MAKLKLVAAPTFKAKVGVPVAGGEKVEVVMEFKHRTRDQWDEWVAIARSKENDPVSAEADLNKFLEYVVGWDLEEEFNRENAALLLQNYYGSGMAAMRVYAEELWSNKLKNSEPSP